MHDEHQGQGTNVDWSELFERISLVDDCPPPQSVMRNLYRSAIEKLWRDAHCTKLDVTRAAVQAAKEAVRSPVSVEEDRRGDPSYHLLAGGRRAFRAAVG